MARYFGRAALHNAMRPTADTPPFIYFRSLRVAVGAGR